MTYNNTILDDQNTGQENEKGNPYKLAAWMALSAAVLALTIIVIVFAMQYFHIRERSTTLREIHRGLKFVPIAAALNSGVFAAYILFFSQTFKKHLKGNVVKSIALAIIVVEIAHLGLMAYGFMDSAYIAGQLMHLGYWLRWWVFVLGYSLPAAIVYYVAWERRLYWLLIVAFVTLAAFQSFMMVYAYPTL